MSKIKDLELRIRVLEGDVEELQDHNEPVGFYNFATLWLKWYPTDLTNFFPEEINYISAYFEKILTRKEGGEQ